MKSKLYLIILVFLVHVSCMGQKNDTNSQNNNEMAEKLDFDFLEKYAKKTQDASGTLFYKLDWHKMDNGTMLKIRGNTNQMFIEQQRPPLPAYWILYKIYDGKGRLKEKGKGLNDYYIKIGDWQYFDSNGNLIKEEDCDKRYGRFSYEQVLKFLREKEHLDQDNAGIENITFFYNEEEKFWHIGVYLTGSRRHEYDLDGTTGKVLSDEIILLVE